MTDDKKFVIAGALLQLLLLGVLITIEHPHLTMGAWLCFALLLVAEFVIYREVRNSREPAARRPPLNAEVKPKRP